MNGTFGSWPQLETLIRFLRRKLPNCGSLVEVEVVMGRRWRFSAPQSVQLGNQDVSLSLPCPVFISGHLPGKTNRFASIVTEVNKRRRSGGTGGTEFAAAPALHVLVLYSIAKRANSPSSIVGHPGFVRRDNGYRSTSVLCLTQFTWCTLCVAGARALPWPEAPTTDDMGQPIWNVFDF